MAGIFLKSPYILDIFILATFEFLVDVCETKITEEFAQFQDWLFLCTGLIPTKLYFSLSQQATILFSLGVFGFYHCGEKLDSWTLMSQ